MSMDQVETFNWMRKRIYKELEPEVLELRAKVAALTLELAKYKIRPIIDGEKQCEDLDGIMEIRLD